MTRTHAYWTCQIGGWTLINVVSCFIMNLTQGFGWEIVLNYVLATGLAIGLTHAFRAYVHHAGWDALPLRQLVPRVLGAMLLLSGAYTAVGDLVIFSGVIDPIGMALEDYWSLSRVLVSMFGSSMLMFMWLAIYFGVHYFWNYRQAEVDKWKLEAQADDLVLGLTRLIEVPPGGLELSEERLKQLNGMLSELAAMGYKPKKRELPKSLLEEEADAPAADGEDADAAREE